MANGQTTPTRPLSDVQRKLKFGIRDVFFLSTDHTIAALATDTQRVTLDTDADFLITHLTRDVRDNAAPQTIIANPAIAILLTMSSSGRQLMNLATHLENLAGTAQLVEKWAAPKFVEGGSTFTVSLTSLLAAGTTYRCRLTFHGFKLFGG